MKILQLWHPTSPGQRVTVKVRWPRYLFDIKFATLGEVRRKYKDEERGLDYRVVHENDLRVG